MNHHYMGKSLEANLEKSDIRSETAYDQVFGALKVRKMRLDMPSQVDIDRTNAFLLEQVEKQFSPHREFFGRFVFRHAGYESGLLKIVYNYEMPGYWMHLNDKEQVLRSHAEAYLNDAGLLKQLRGHTLALAEVNRLKCA
jgi:hypothetical protein